MYFKTKYLNISDTEIKQMVFVGTQIRESTQDVKFEGQLNEVAKAAWK